MTRYGGLGRTRPKKLTSKASIPIVREHEIDVVDDEIHSTLQQIETGVEKAEESVSASISHLFLASSLHVIT
jgi:enhancer of polycomb-like protein